MIDRISVNKKALKHVHGDYIACCYGNIMSLVRSLDLFYSFGFKPEDGSTSSFDDIFDPKLGAGRILARCKSSKSVRMTVNMRIVSKAILADIVLLDEKKNILLALQVEASDGCSVKRIDSRY